ncbi:class I SAM-dependent methyltransferase [Alcanivorax xiamenensis]|nr:methyltransferase domain-containing protein [Alcanivorax xiamenensis]
MNPTPNFGEATLIWWPEYGMGHHPAAPMNYDGSYWSEYRERDASAMGAQLTAARVDLVRRHWAGEVVDVGIGGGRFVEEVEGQGFDVNPEAIAWLKAGDRYRNPYHGVDAVTCWDSLEHIVDPAALVASARHWVFVSMPIYANAQDCLQSRHYKPSEHLWYWEHDGLIRWFQRLGFECREHNTMESILGRDGIHSYAFRRTA